MPYAIGAGVSTFVSLQDSSLATPPPADANSFWFFEGVISNTWKFVTYTASNSATDPFIFLFQLAGRTGGQTAIGGTGSAETLTLQSTAHATKGKILFGTSGYDEVNNRLGIGTNAPVVNLHVLVAGGVPNSALYASGADAYLLQNDTNSTNMRLLHCGTSAANGCNIVGLRSRGTAASPGAAVADDMCLTITGQGYDGSARQVAVRIQSLVDGTVSGGVVPGRVLISTANSSGALIDRLKIDSAGLWTLFDGSTIHTGTSTGTKIGTATSQKIGFYNATPVVQQTRGATLTNSVTAGGTDDTIANFTDLTLYANDAATIRNNIYQLARILRQHDVALRALGLES